MDFAEIPRSMPQFGKSMRNLIRSREEVFHPRMVASRRGRGMRCCGEAGADSVGRAACGCGGREGPTRGILNDSISDGPWSGGNDLPWIESDGIIIDVGRPLVLVQAGFCCVAVYCYLIEDPPPKGQPAVFPHSHHRNAVHCYFQGIDCTGAIFRLELDPNQVNIAMASGKADRPIHMVVMLKGEAPNPKKDIFEFSACQPCGDGLAGSSCQIIDCLLSESLNYPFGVVQPEELPKPGESLRDMVLPTSAHKPAYKLTGPNSNTCVAYVARKCGLPALHQIRKGRKPAFGAKASSDYEMERYWGLRMDWMEGRGYVRPR